MALAQAIRKNTISLALKQTTYKENVIAVNTLITSVLTSSLPTLNSNPPDWATFVTAYEQANGDALDWVNNVMARLLSVPDEVRTYNNSIVLLLQNAKTQAQALIDNPDDYTALATLQADLNNLTAQFSLIVSFISGALTAIRNFQDKLPDMAVQLQAIADKSAKDANADRQQIDQLNADIDNLHSEIKSLTAAIVALGIADGVALTLGVVATIAAWPVGALTWLVLGPAVAVASTYIALDAEKIKAAKAKIEGDEQQIQGLTADVATLQILAKNFGAMAAQTQEIETNLQAVLRAWQSLESDVSASVTDISTALADAGSAQYSAVMDELNDAVSEWTAAYQQAGDLHLDLQVNNAALQVGMTSDQVKAAVSAATTLDIIAYFNQMRSRQRRVA